MTPHTVVFVCQHGALRSRLAAAFFNAAAPDGWRAASAGLEPQQAVSEHAARLLAGDPAEARLEVGAPVGLSEAGHAARVVAIDCAVTGAASWRLSAREVDGRLGAELKTRVGALIEELGVAAD